MNPKLLFANVFQKIGSSYNWRSARAKEFARRGWALSRDFWAHTAPQQLFDRRYAEKRFSSMFGYALDLQEPRTFNEKIQWLKLNNRQPIMKRLADKYSAREYVSEKVGSIYLNNLLGVYESAEALQSDLNTLPDRFVVKATHGSGWNVLVTNKNKLSTADWAQMNSWLGKDYYYLGREWCYHDIFPRLICETYIEPIDPDFGVIDYKFFCFHGKPAYIQVDVGRFTNHKRNIYDINWDNLPVEYLYPNCARQIPRPDRLDEMLEVAAMLSENLTFARIDLYDESRVLFGEITFYPENGFGKFSPTDWDARFGELLRVP